MNNGYINRTICVAAANRVSGIRSKVTSSPLFRPLFPPLPELSLPPPPRASSARLLFRSVLPLLVFRRPFRARYRGKMRTRFTRVWKSRAMTEPRETRYSRETRSYLSLSRVRDVDAPMSNRLCLDFDELARLCCSGDRRIMRIR